MPSASSLPPAPEPATHGDVNQDPSADPHAEGGGNRADGGGAPSLDEAGPAEGGGNLADRGAGHTAYYMCKYFGEQCDSVTVADADTPNP